MFRNTTAYVIDQVYKIIKTTYTYSHITILSMDTEWLLSYI